MRLLLVLPLLALAACGGSEEAEESSGAREAQLAACYAVERTLETAVEAFEAVNGAPPATLEEMLGDFIEEDRAEELAWFELDGSEISPADSGPC